LRTAMASLGMGIASMWVLTIDDRDGN
jgi:hypothetical protein